MTTANLDSADLKAVDYQGLINEDVMQQIWDISNIPLPFTDAVGSDTTGNSYTSWTTDQLGDPALGGWIVDGADSDQNDSATGARIGNHCGILTREVQVSSRADASDTIGTSSELSYQIMMRQKELRRNVEANALHIQGSVEDDGNTTAGQPAGLATMMTAFDTGSGATAGSFSAGEWTGVVAGTKTALTETMIRDAAQEAWESGANPGKLMSVPSVCRKLSEYMFSSSARIATLTGETNNNGPATAMGSVNVFLTDFGVTMDFVPNRIQQTYADVGASDQVAAVFLYDPSYVRMTYLEGYRVESLAKTGLSEKRLMAVDWTVKMLEPDSGRVLLDIDPTAAVTE